MRLDLAPLSGLFLALSLCGSASASPAFANVGALRGVVSLGPLEEPASAIVWRTQVRSQSLYVANNGNRTITVYAALANGNAAPVRSIGGTNTLMYGTIGGLAQDGAGNLYVGDGRDGILVFAPGAHGNVAPIRRIFGPNTGLGNVQALAVDTAGTVFAATEVFANGRPSYARLLRFGAGADGNVKPAAMLVPGQEIDAIALDSTGSNIIVTAPALQSSSASNTYTYARTFAANATALYDVGGFVGGALVSDPGNASYFEYAYDQNEVVRLANDTQGTTYPSGSFANLKPAPRQFLAISPAGLALDFSRNLYGSFGGPGTGSVNVYPNGAIGFARPSRQISGPNTLLSQPQSIYVGT